MTDDQNYYQFITSIVQHQHRWGEFEQWTYDRWSQYAEDNHIDYRCRRHMKRNICLRVYGHDGRLITAEELIRLYTNGQRSIMRTLQHGRRGRVWDFE